MFIHYLYGISISNYGLGGGVMKLLASIQESFLKGGKLCGKKGDVVCMVW